MFRLFRSSPRSIKTRHKSDQPCRSQYCAVSFEAETEVSKQIVMATPECVELALSSIPRKHGTKKSQQVTIGSHKSCFGSARLATSSGTTTKMSR